MSESLQSSYSSIPVTRTLTEDRVGAQSREGHWFYLGLSPSSPHPHYHYLALLPECKQQQALNSLYVSTNWQDQLSPRDQESQWGPRSTVWFKAASGDLCCC